MNSATPASCELDSADDLRLLQTRLRQKAEMLLLDPRADLESGWGECLLFPLRGFWQLTGLAVALASLVAGLVLIEPSLETQGFAWAMEAVFLVFSSGLAHCVFRGASGGIPGWTHGPRRVLRQVPRGTAEALWCFLAGPIVPAAMAFWFWYHSGDLQWLDWLILGELVILSVAACLLLWMTVLESGRLADAHAASAIKLLGRVGRTLLIGAALGGVLGLAHLLLIVVAMEQVHRDGIRGWFLLAAFWFSALCSFTFLFRWLGLSCYWSRT